MCYNFGTELYEGTPARRARKIRKIRGEDDMKKILFVPDSFKGTMSSSEVCSIMARAVRQNYPKAEIISIPVADGGEGTVDAFLAAMGGEKRRVITRDLFFEEISSFYGVVDNGKTAIIEMAACAGLPLAEGHPDPRRATTYGVGQLIAHAAQSGCRKIILGLGGSATNDGGAGAATALGIRFFDTDGREFVPTGGLCPKSRRLTSRAEANRLMESSLSLCAMSKIPFTDPRGRPMFLLRRRGRIPQQLRY